MSSVPAEGSATPLFDVVLRTTRLVLRPLSPQDAEPLFAIYSDPEFTRYWSSLPWRSLEEATDYIERDRQQRAAGQCLRLGIFLQATRELVGTCSLFNLNLPCRRAELGYGIARAHWRRGYQFEAVSVLIRFAFAELGFHRLEADVDPRNISSLRSLEKLGFVREGLMRERWIVGEEISDSAIFGLLARDWASRVANTA
jgi:RimJ/RimL family protein N-acetyltransferase